jgi:hypothetical protein
VGEGLGGWGELGGGGELGVGGGGGGGGKHAKALTFGSGSRLLSFRRSTIDSCEAVKDRAELASLPTSSAVGHSYAAFGSKRPRSNLCLKELKSALSTSVIVIPSVLLATALRRLPLYVSPELMSHCPSFSASAVAFSAVGSGCGYLWSCQAFATLSESEVT